ncbi:hypothetical protein [Massilia putida]|uniref:hypothetical protein n=1 Tax=Massilia putida TaxID=1141883 RepID=UPI00095144C8|nr:hypothetical protein [Massilia putida]
MSDELKPRESIGDDPEFICLLKKLAPECEQLGMPKTRALIAHIDAWRVPPGMKLVPIEPTLDMVTQGFESWPDPFFSKPEEWDAYKEMTGCEKAAHRAKLCWSAMIAAAPAADTNQTEEK